MLILRALTSLTAAALLFASAPQLHAQYPFVKDHSTREAIEWEDTWIPDTNVTNLPHILLIGDSITRIYYPAVQDALKGKATVGRMSTSKCAADPSYIGELALLLKQYHFDIIQFNNGMHGWGYSEDQYRKGIEAAEKVIRRLAPNARIAVATTTPVREAGKLDEVSPKTERVRARNRIVTAVFARDHVTVVDLFQVMADHPENYRDDGVHPNDKGAALEAAAVTAQMKKMLP